MEVCNVSNGSIVPYLTNQHTYGKFGN